MRILTQSLWSLAAARWRGVVPPGWGTAEKYSHCDHWQPPGGEELCPLDGDSSKIFIVVIGRRQLERSCDPWIGTAEKYSHCGH